MAERRGLSRGEKAFFVVVAATGMFFVGDTDADPPTWQPCVGTYSTTNPPPPACASLPPPQPDR